MIPTRSAPKVTVRREIEASADDLFDAWLDPASLAVWMRPGDIAHCRVKIDPTIGGVFEIVMYNAAGAIVHTGVYTIIDRPRRLAFTWISPGTKQTESLVTIDFHSIGRMTEIVLTHEQLPDESVAQAHTKGWTRILELLALEAGAVLAHKPSTHQS